MKYSKGDLITLNNPTTNAKALLKIDDVTDRGYSFICRIIYANGNEYVYSGLNYSDASIEKLIKEYQLEGYTQVNISSLENKKSSNKTAYVVLAIVAIASLLIIKK